MTPGQGWADAWYQAEWVLAADACQAVWGTPGSLIPDPITPARAPAGLSDAWEAGQQGQDAWQAIIGGLATPVDASLHVSDPSLQAFFKAWHSDGGCKTTPSQSLQIRTSVPDPDNPNPTRNLTQLNGTIHIERSPPASQLCRVMSPEVCLLSPHVPVALNVCLPCRPPWRRGRQRRSTRPCKHLRSSVSHVTFSIAGLLQPGMLDAWGAAAERHTLGFPSSTKPSTSTECRPCAPVSPS